MLYVKKRQNDNKKTRVPLGLRFARAG
jgi:hypothetical protein